MAAWNLDALARVSATGLVNSLAVGSLVALLAWIFLRLGGRRDSSSRFAVWLSALFLMAGLPWAGTTAARVFNPAHGTSFEIALPASWAAGVFWFWAVGASLALLRVGIAFWQLLKLRWRCEPLSIELLAANAQNRVRPLEQVRGTRICVSDQVRVPTAVGFFKPLIVIPRWALEELSGEELNAVLIHELEHLRRRDDWTNLAQKLLRALLFFHPAVWWIDRKLALEREIACDDAVLAKTRDRRAYAACLVTVAEKSLVRRGLALAQAAVSRVQQTTLRVTQILQGEHESASGVWRPVGYLLGAISVCGLLALSQAPPLVEFQAGPPTLAATPSPALSATMVSEHLSTPAPRVVLARANRPIIKQAKSAGVNNDSIVAESRRAEAALLESLAAPVQSMAPADSATAPAMLVVFHGEERTPFGTSYWTICVWRVDAPGKATIDLQKRIPAKSI